MPYRNTTFDGINLPAAMPEDDLGTGPAQSTLVDSLAGSVDFLGGNRYYPKRHPIRHTGLYVGQTTYLVDEAGNNIVDEAGNYIVMSGSDAAHLRAQVDAITSQIGRRGELRRRRETDRAEQLKLARLLSIGHIHTVRDVGRIAKVDLAFEAVGTPWRSVTATTITSSLTANATTSVAVSTVGEEEVRDARLTITATSVITIVTIALSSVSGIHAFTYTGTIAAGQKLIIDCGAMTVQNNGADAYSGFALSATHTAPGWLTLATSTVNYVSVTLVGGGGTLDVVFYDQWM